MDIDEYLDEIDRLWPKSSEYPTKAIIDLCLEAVAEHPESSTLWHAWGIIMHRSSEDYGYGREDLLQCFENAIKCDETNAEAYQELGYLLDVYYEEYDKAEKAFQKAIGLGAGHESYYGRARVLAEMGKTNCALDSLSDENCPFSKNLDIQKLRCEILDGSWSPEYPTPIQSDAKTGHESNGKR